MWSTIRRAAMLLTGVILTSGIAAAQSPPADPQFDVMSVKPNTGNGPQSMRVTPGRAAVTNIPLKTLIQFAYQVQPRELADAPDWISVERFDIIATANPSSSVEQMRIMLRGLLADRFKLKVHREKRELPIYALTLARRDGKFGPNLHESAVDCAANGARPLDANAQDPAQQDPAKRCMLVPLFNLGRFQARGLHMENVASALNNVVDRTIVDKTGLKGAFEFDLSWTPDALQPANAGPTAAPRPEVSGPSLFSALQEQLGLKLNAERDQIEVLVIDRVERPTPD
jgi:uncharacterized protein (TIGR03435 family)